MNVPRPPSVSRRTALSAAVGAVAVGTACTPNSANKPARRSAAESTPEPLPDVALAMTVVADEQDLLDLIDAAVGRHPRLEQTLGEARAAHEAHIALLQDAADGSSSPSPEATPSTDGTTERQGRDRVPGDPTRAVRALARREDELALVVRRSAFAAESGAFARVLASMAASAAQQATLLRTAAVPAGGRR